MEINVILADNNDLMRAGLRSILSPEKNIKIVSEAKSSEELKSQVKSFSPDVVLIDYTSNEFQIDVIPQILASIEL